MLKNKDELLNKILDVAKWVKKISGELFGELWQKLRTKITAWWQVALIAVFLVVFLYYPLGGWLINNIDTSAKLKREKVVDGRLEALDVASFLINREVYYKIWTPNLPFVFPSYFLDNMPNFQMGVLSAIEKAVTAFGSMPLVSVSDEARDDLGEAVKFLKYPPKVWMFSPENKLKPAPSSSTQYKKGRKKLNNFNAEVAKGKVLVDRSNQNLALVLHVVKKDIERVIEKVNEHVQENSKSVCDFRKDDVFYYAQGKLYAYSQILKALGKDFKNVLVKNDVYQQWTAVLKLLRQAADLNPTIVRNGKPNSSFSPNHLITISYYSAYAVNKLDFIVNKLD